MSGAQYWQQNLFTRLLFASLEKASAGAWIGAYVLMPDHLHVFVGLDDRKIDLRGG
jgi:hypothetical protein